MNVALIPTTNSSCRSPRWATLWMTAVIQLHRVEPSGRSFSPRYLKCQVPKQQPGRRGQKPKCWGEDITYNKPEGTRWENWSQGAEQEFKPGTKKREESKCWSKEIHREKKERRRKGRKEEREEGMKGREIIKGAAIWLYSTDNWLLWNMRAIAHTSPQIHLQWHHNGVAVSHSRCIYTREKGKHYKSELIFSTSCQTFLSTSLMWSLILRTKICELSFLVGRFIGTWVEQSCSNGCEERDEWTRAWMNFPEGIPNKNT